MRWHPTVNVVELDLWRFTYEEKAGREWKLAEAERHRRSPEGELAGATESAETSARNESPVVQQLPNDKSMGVPKFPN